jgi:hypothetical protein
MNVVVHIPDALADRFGGDIPRQALEALGLDAYRAGRLTKAELGRLLAIPTRFELDAFLKAHDVHEPYSLEEIDREVADLQRLGF